MNPLFDKLSYPSLCSAAATILLFSHQAAAAEWKITPSVNLNETYSDNVTLAPRGSEKSDWVTQINPGVSLNGVGSRLKADASYVMQNLGYAQGNGRSMTRHQLNAGANAELADNLFFLEGQAAISQQNTSQLGPQATDNTSATGNRTDVKTSSISPYLRHHSGDFASSEIRYTHSEVNTGASGLSDSRTDRIQLQSNSGTAFRTLGWGVNYSNEKTANTNIQDIDRESLSGNLRYLITPKLSLTATGGYEKNSYVSIASKPEDSFWAAGFSWTPSTKTSINASAGQRFFGNTYSLDASHRARSTVWSLGYSEDITTTQSQFLIPVTISTATFLDQLWAAQIPDTTTRQLFVDAFIQSNGLPAALSESVNFLTNRVFLQKRLQASVAVTGKKNTLIISLFNALRDAQTSQAQDSILLGNANRALNDQTKQVGGNASWIWRIGQRTSASLNAAYTRNSDSSLGNTNNNRSVRFGLTRQFQPKLSGSIELRQLQQGSSQSSNYREKAIMASLSMKF